MIDKRVTLTRMNLARDPEARYTETGGSVVVFPVWQSEITDQIDREGGFNYDSKQYKVISTDPHPGDPNSFINYSCHDIGPVKKAVGNPS